MPNRKFKDSRGTEWQVWDVVPRLSERRTDEFSERRETEVAIRFEDRRRETRRLTDARRAVLKGTYATGWLCFESVSEKRRLSPIPEDWLTCSTELLERYNWAAERASGAHPAVQLPLAEAG